MGRVPLPSIDDIDAETVAKIRITEAKMGHVPANGLLFARVPGLADVPFAVQMEPNLVVEFYSR
jgi:hypothetical protein